MPLLKKKKKTEQEKLEEELKKALARLKKRDKGLELEAEKINAKFGITDAPVMVKTHYGPFVVGD